MYVCIHQSVDLLPEVEQNFTFFHGERHVQHNVASPEAGLPTGPAAQTTATTER